MFNADQTRSRIRIAAVAVVSLALFQAARPGAASAAPPEIVVRVHAAGKPISPHMYGIFYEEINHAGDGGLYAQLVRNPNFADALAPGGMTLQNGKAVGPNGYSINFNTTNKLPGWRLLAGHGARATVKLARRHPMNRHQSTSLRLRIAAPGSRGAGVANVGYWGMNIQRGAKYNLMVYARAAAGHFSHLRVLLKAPGGRVLARSALGPLTSRWKKFTCTLTGSAANKHGRLALLAHHAGTIDLGFVSLFPADTWKHEKNGLRPDIAQKLAALTPGFVRFPGGSYIEGVTMQDAYDWQKTVGAIADRPGHWDLWGYRTTDGLGLLEFLRMCQDLHAAPLMAINAGVSNQEDEWRHSGRTPADRGSAYAPRGRQLNHWVHIALHAIAFANAPANTRWGRMRAKDGHPAPFHLHYIEVGNEDGGNMYNRHYAVLYRDIKARYPHMKLIATTPVPGQPMDIVDDHFYNSPQWFFDNYHHYDHVTRNGPKIFVGEYACTQGVGQGDLEGALSEAAFMCGLERNCDLVRMASYAPLFVNIHDRTWPVDLIGFNSSSSFGYPSYYTQKLFANNRGDIELPVHILHNARANNAIARRGGIGLSTWNTQDEFRRIVVTAPSGKVLYRSHFRRGMGAWKALHGHWKVRHGVLEQTAGGEEKPIILPHQHWTNYTLFLQAKKISGAEGFLVEFRLTSANNWVRWDVGGWNNTAHALQTDVNGDQINHITPLTPEKPIAVGRWYNIRIVVHNRRVHCYLNGRLLDQTTLPAGSRSLFACASRDAVSGDLIVKVVNRANHAVKTQLVLQGAPHVNPEGRAIVLANRNANATNSIAHPTRVVPKRHALTGLSQRSPITFAANSLTVLRIKTGK